MNQFSKGDTVRVEIKHNDYDAHFKTHVQGKTGTVTEVVYQEGGSLPTIVNVEILRGDQSPLRADFDPGDLVKL